MLQECTCNQDAKSTKRHGCKKSKTMNSLFTISNNGDVLCECSTEAVGTITIPKGLLAIRQNAFKHCKGITNVVFPSMLKIIGCNAFIGCTSLESIQLPDGLKYLGEGAFMDCQCMKSAIIPASVRELPTSAFENNYSLENVELPESGLFIIGDKCFKRCMALKSIVIPHSVVSIGSAFTSCEHLVKVIMRTENVRVKRSAFRYDSSNLTIEYAGKTVTKKQFFGIIHPNNVKQPVRIIRKKDFAGKVRKPNMLRLKLPNGIETIEEKAFQDCTGLQEIDIPQSVCIIRPRTFSGCCGLTRVSIAEGVLVIDKGAFENCTSLMNLHLPDSLKEIDSHAFAGCTSLRNVSISHHTSVAETAFDANKNLKITIRQH